MGNFNKGGDRGGRGGFGGDRGGRGGFGGGRDRERPEMHEATCADCGKRCEVPFRPTGEKPVFCSDCFGNKRGGDSRDHRDGGRDSRPSYGGRDSRPSYGDKKPRHDDGGRKPENYKAQFEQINARLDKIMRLLNPIDSDSGKKYEKALKQKKEVDTAAVREVLSKLKDENLSAEKAEDKKLLKKKTTKKTARSISSGQVAKKPIISASSEKPAKKAVAKKAENKKPITKKTVAKKKK